MNSMDVSNFKYVSIIYIEKNEKEKKKETFNCLVKKAPNLFVLSSHQQYNM